MAKMPPQGRVSDKTPNEWFNEIFPLLSMVLLAKELLNLARKHNIARLEVNLDSQEGRQERQSLEEQTAQTMTFLKRIEDCIMHYGGEAKVVPDITAMWRESVSRGVVISKESESAASFDLLLGPTETFLTSLDGVLWSLLTDNLAEETHVDVDRMRVMLLDCLS